jgi:hypothetical protein
VTNSRFQDIARLGYELGRTGIPFVASLCCLWNLKVVIVDDACFRAAANAEAEELVVPKLRLQKPTHIDSVRH